MQRIYYNVQWPKSNIFILSLAVLETNFNFSSVYCVEIFFVWAMWNVNLLPTPVLKLFVVSTVMMILSVNSWKLDLKKLTEGEQVAIDQLRELVKSELTAEYMEEDAYLVKWLSAKEFNVEKAAQLLIENLDWRREQNIDHILKENWTEMEAEFPYQRNTVDLYGQPILYFYFGQWDIHKLITEEDSLVTLGRYMVKMIEESDQHVRKLRQEHGEGSLSPAQFNLIINFDGYSIWNQGCFQCLAFYRGFGQTLENHFPRSIERVVLVNVPITFEIIFWYVEAVLAEKTRRSVKIYGHNRKVWMPAILNYVHKDQIPGELVQMPLLSPGKNRHTTTRGTLNITLNN